MIDKKDVRIAPRELGNQDMAHGIGMPKFEENDSIVVCDANGTNRLIEQIFAKQHRKCLRYGGRFSRVFCRINVEMRCTKIDDDKKPPFFLRIQRLKSKLYAI